MHRHNATIKTLIFSLMIPLSIFGQNRQYWQVKLARPMTVSELMSKYKLDEYDCNAAQFLKINALVARNTSLAIGKIYNLPVWIYDFNGKSIRSSVGTTDLDLAKTVQSFNADMQKIGLRQTTYQSSHILLVPYHVLNCRGSRKATLPKGVVEASITEGSERVKNPTGKTQTYAIFGRKYQDVPILDKRMKGKIFYVEGGHGGPDPGAQAKVDGRTLCEDEYAYDVSLRVARELIQHGATVFIITRDPDDGIRDGEFLTCDTDEQTFPDLKVPYNQKLRLTQRSDAVNEIYDKFKKKGITDQRLIVIHVDSRGKSQQTDTFLYYQNDSEASLKLAKAMQKTLESKYARYRDYKGTLTTRDLHMLRECKPTTVYVELGNIRNDFDRKRLMLKNNRQAIALWLAEGFMK